MDAQTTLKICGVANVRHRPFLLTSSRMMTRLFSGDYTSDAIARLTLSILPLMISAGRLRRPDARRSQVGKRLLLQGAPQVQPRDQELAELVRRPPGSNQIHNVMNIPISAAPAEKRKAKSNNGNFSPVLPSPPPQVWPHLRGYGYCPDPRLWGIRPQQSRPRSHRRHEPRRAAHDAQAEG